MGAEGLLDHERLGGVVDLGRGAVRVVVGDIRRRHPGVFEGQGDGPRAARPFRVGGGEVVGVAGRAVAGELGVDPRAARYRFVPVLEDEDRRALAHQEAVAVLVERPRRELGPVVEGGAERLQPAERADRELGDRRLGSARDDRVAAARADEIECLTDRVGARGAGGDCRVGRPENAQPHRDVGGAFVRDHQGHGHREHPSRAGFEHLLVGLHHHFDSADADAHEVATRSGEYICLARSRRRGRRSRRRGRRRARPGRRPRRRIG